MEFRQATCNNNRDGPSTRLTTREMAQAQTEGRFCSLTWLFSLKKLETNLQPEALALGIWLAGELNRYDNSSEVNMEQLLGKIMQKVREQELAEAELAAGIDVCMSLTGLYGCCVMVNLAHAVINGKKEEGQRLARYVIVGATNFLDMKARKGPLSEMEVEFAKFVLSKADQVGLSRLSAMSLQELKKAIG
jgi:hypothetical protein